MRSKTEARRQRRTSHPPCRLEEVEAAKRIVDGELQLKPRSRERGLLRPEGVKNSGCRALPVHPW
jgi:hypothetical protein